MFPGLPTSSDCFFRVLLNISHVPRPSHHSVCDRLQYEKMEGEGLVHFITYVITEGAGERREERGQTKEIVEQTDSIYDHFACKLYWPVTGRRNTSHTLMNKQSTVLSFTFKQCLDKHSLETTNVQHTLSVTSPFIQWSILYKLFFGSFTVIVAL